MLRFFAWAIGIAFILFVVAQFGSVVRESETYVLVVFNEWEIVTNVWVAGIVMSALLLSLYLISRLVVWLLSFTTLFSSARYHDWWEGLGYRRANRKTARGLVCLAQGEWQKAEQLLTQAAHQTNTPLANFLAASWAAHELHENQRRDELLKKALQSTKDSQIIVGLVKAQLEVNRDQLEQALATLKELKTRAPNNTFALKLHRKVLIKLKDWQGLLALMPNLKKAKVLSDEEIAQSINHAWISLFQESAKQHREVEKEKAQAAIDDIYRQVPRALKQQHDITYAYVKALHDLALDSYAEQQLRGLLKRQWHNEWVVLYGLLKGQDLKKQLEVAEGWMAQQPNNPHLMLTLGRLSLRCKDWNKAKEYFNNSLKITPSAEVYGELGRLLAHLGDTQQSAQVLQQGLQLSLEKLPELPMPQAKPTPGLPAR